MPTVSPMTPIHLDAVMRIQADCYPADMQEGRELLAARLACALEQCWVAEDRDGVCGYLFGYLSWRGKVTPLNGAFAASPTGNCLYLHDLAVAPRAKGRRIGQRLVETALASPGAPDLAWSALVSVQDSAAFWERQGYCSTTPTDAEQVAHLNSYGAPARYMERALSRAARRGQIAGAVL